jgi:hypothetical protein
MKTSKILIVKHFCKSQSRFPNIQPTYLNTNFYACSPLFDFIILYSLAILLRFNGND